MVQKDVRLIRLDMQQQERSMYDKMWDVVRKIFTWYVEEGTVLKNYSHIREIILRLRQSCCHLDLVMQKIGLNACGATSMGTAADLSKVDMEKLLGALTRATDEGDECCICLKSIDRPVITECAHVFCSPCMDTLLLSGHKVCPLCRLPISKETLQESQALLRAANALDDSSMDTEPDDPTRIANSTKLQALLNYLQETKQRDPTIKTVVFSQWTSFLDLISNALNGAEISHVKLDGRMTRARRDLSIESFRQDPEVRVILISLSAGGVGLTLTEASQVVLMDP
mmetsp:Transcript_26849/g.67497  ORF Transcript_26849/g.67497 Transcript_26849/m.67497 type:complete len:284 (+) Transcript_26849:3177-4028(+)